MISKTISKTDLPLPARGIPEDSYFEATFSDGSVVDERDTNWSAFSKKEDVNYFGRTLNFFISNFPIVKIKTRLNGMEACIEEISEGTRVYQFIRSERMLAKGVDRNLIIGRGIGLVRDGVVIEERFINAIENRVQGMRK